MDTYEFMLVIAGEPESEAAIDALYDAGCDDATFSSIDGVGYADFSREARSLAEAVCSAISAINTVPGLQVIRVQPDDLQFRSGA